MSKRRALIALLLLIASLAPRIVYLQQTRELSYFKLYTLDGEWYRQRAEEVSSGELLSERSHFRGPLYPWFVAAVFGVAGEDQNALRLVQLLLGGLNGVLIWLVAKRFVSPPAAILASLLYAGYGMPIYFDGEILTLTLEITLLLLYLWAITDARRAAPLLAGGLLGLSALARPSILPIALPSLVYLAYRAPSAPRSRGRRGGAEGGWRRPALRPLLLYLAALAFVTAPVVVGYRVMLGDWIPISSQGGINFYLGSHRGANGSAAITPSTGDLDMMIADEYSDTVAEGSTRVAERAMGRRLLPSEVSRYWYRRAFSFAAQSPGEFAALCLKRLYLLVSNQETDNNQDVPYFLKRHAPWVRAMPIGPAVIVGLGLVGLLGARGRRASFIAGSWAILALATAAFLVMSRYRIPLLILLLPYAGLTLERLAREARAGAWGVLAARGTPVIVLIGLSAALLYSVRSERVLAAQHHTLGTVENRAGNPAGAIEEYRLALEYDPNGLSARYALGNALINVGRRSEARREFQALLDADPRYAPFVANSLGIIALEEGDARAAAEAFRQALAGDPAPTTRANLGIALLSLGEESEAREPGSGRERMLEALAQLERAWSAESVTAEVGVDVARARLALGDTARAVTELREIVSVDSRVTRGWLILADVQRARGERAAEVEALRGALRASPGLPEARERLAALGAEPS